MKKISMIAVVCSFLLLTGCSAQQVASNSLGVVGTVAKAAAGTAGAVAGTAAGGPIGGAAGAALGSALVGMVF